MAGDPYGVQIGPGNEFTDLNQGGCDPNHVDPVQGLGSRHTLIIGNWFHDNHGSGGILSANEPNLTVTNNVFASCCYPHSIVVKGAINNTYTHNVFIGDISWELDNDSKCGGGELVRDNVFTNRGHLPWRLYWNDLHGEPQPQLSLLGQQQPHREAGLRWRQQTNDLRRLQARRTLCREGRSVRRNRHGYQVDQPQLRNGLSRLRRAVREVDRGHSASPMRAAQACLPIMLVWADIENEPQVQYLLPLIQACRRRGADDHKRTEGRSHAHTAAPRMGESFKAVGASYGAARAAKVRGLVRRSRALGALIRREGVPRTVSCPRRARPRLSRGDTVFRPA